MNAAAAALISRFEDVLRWSRSLFRNTEFVCHYATQIPPAGLDNRYPMVQGLAL